MYQPPHFVETELDVLHALIRAHPLGLLISTGPDGPVANPLPFLLDADIGPNGRLRAHLAQGQSAMAAARRQSGNAGAGRLPGRRQLRDAVLVRDQARDRQGRADLELRHGAGARHASRVIEDQDWLAGQIAELTATQEAEPRRSPGR